MSNPLLDLLHEAIGGFTLRDAGATTQVKVREALAMVEAGFVAERGHAIEPQSDQRRPPEVHLAGWLVIPPAPPPVVFTERHKEYAYAVVQACAPGSYSSACMDAAAQKLAELEAAQ